MRSVSILSIASLLAFAAAQPAMKRDMVTVTKVETVVKTVDVTSTVYAGEVVPEETSVVAQPSHVAGHGHHHVHSPVKPSSTVEPEHTHIKPHTHTTVQPVEPTTTVQPAQPTTTVAPSPTTPTTTEVAPTSTSQPSSGGSGTTHSGDITHYAPGLGSCGITSTSSEDIVALSHFIMDPVSPSNPNDNPLCGQKITISYGGKTSEATVVDTCEGCSETSIDLSPSLFQKFANMGVGRVSGVEWSFNSAAANALY